MISSTPMESLLMLVIHLFFFFAPSLPPPTAEWSPSLAHQDPPAPPSVTGRAATPDLLASDGKPALPGRIPEDTSDRARARWSKVRLATAAADLDPIVAFDLTFDVRYRRSGGMNKGNISIQYLEQGEVPNIRIRFERKDVESLRGPRGDYLITKGEAQRMAGRQYAEDVKQLDRFVAIARNFITLTRPDRLTLVSLTALVTAPLAENGRLDPGAKTRVDFLGADPLELPDEQLAERARGLEWVEVRSPDFRLVESVTSRNSRQVFRALLGLDPVTGEVRLAVLGEDQNRTVVLQNTQLVIIEEYRELEGGYRVPAALEIRDVDATVSPWTFQRRNGTSLYLSKKSRAQLNPPLRPADFVPR
ncbi:MAG: hypothetical protein V3T22_07585 [Planctomycetota bacterium]